jgi:hypothetical protein
MNICPLCNGFRDFCLYCSQCGGKLDEKGKIMDYFGPYSPYMEINLMKRVDGFTETLSQHMCAHLFYCPRCNNEEIRLIKE